MFYYHFSVYGSEEDPLTVMEKLGFNVIQFEEAPIADCCIFLTENKIENLPSYIRQIDHFNFYKE